MRQERHRLAVDIGGTFTDLVLLDEDTGEIRTMKVSSTPREPSEAVLNGVRRVRDELEIELERAGRYDHLATLVFLDLDEFKQINDTLGHVEGDRVLTLVGMVLLSMRRGSDLAGRLGGDELVAWVDGDGDGVVAQIDMRLPGALNAAGLPMCTVSTGVARAFAEGTDVESLLAAADSRMYAMKRGPRPVPRAA
jgi:diguanylate cyclase (GGDEF)-like protein